MKNILFILLLTFIIVINPLSIEDDISDFDELLDVEQEGENVDDDDNIFKQLSENLSSTYLLRYNFFLNELITVEPDVVLPEPSLGQHLYEIGIKFSNYIKGSFWKIYTEGWFETGNQKETYTDILENIEDMGWQQWFQDKSLMRNHFQISEFYLSLFLDILDIHIGKKITVNTLSSIYTPADIYAILDTNDPVFVRKIGRLSIEIDIYLGNYEFKGIFSPIYESNKTYNPLSRWGYYSYAPYSQLATIIPLSDNYPEINIENMSYFLRFKGTEFGFDFFLSSYYGLSQMSVFKLIGFDVIPVLEETVVPVLQLSTGFSKTVDRFELHGEAIHNYSFGSKDDDYIRFVIGGRCLLDDFPNFIPLKKIEITLEYAGEHIFNNQSDDDYVKSSEERRLFKNDILAHFNIEVLDKLFLNIIGQYEINPGSFILRAYSEYKEFHGFTLGLGCEAFFTKEESSFYSFRDNSRLITWISLDM